MTTPNICLECLDTLTDSERLDLGTGRCEACQSCVCDNCKEFIPNGDLTNDWTLSGPAWHCLDCYDPTPAGPTYSPGFEMNH